MIELWQVVLGALITMLGSYGAARYAGKSSVKVKEIDIDAAAYERADKINQAAFQRLEKEVSDLKSSHESQGKEIDALKKGMEKVTRVFRVAINFIEQFLLWERDGAHPPRPNIPHLLKEYLDPSLIREHIRQQGGPS